MKKKTNTSGSVSVFRFEENDTYTMADLLYVNSQHNSIERMYAFLQVFYQWCLNKKHLKTATQVVGNCKIDNHILSVMKKYNYLDDKCNWILNNQPSKADAVFLRLKLNPKRGRKEVKQEINN